MPSYVDVARRKAMGKRRAAGADARRMRLVRESEWTTEQLAEQALSEQYVTPRELQRARERCPEDAALRTWLAWQLSEARLLFGKPDPIPGTGQTPGTRGNLPS